MFAAIDRISRVSADLYIAVPNGARIMFNDQNGLPDDCPPNHTSRWSPRSFNVLAGKYGWAVEACEFEPAPTTPIYGAVNRYIRNSHQAGSWSRFTYGVANRNFWRSRPMPGAPRWRWRSKPRRRRSARAVVHLRRGHS